MSIFDEKPLGYALKENARVISALVVRNAITRFSKSRFGFIWILSEPAAYVGIFLAIHTFVKSQVPFGDNAALFILAGVFGFRMTPGISRKTERAIIGNQPMLAYPPIRPLDTIVATFLLEATIWIMICALFMGGLAYTMDRLIIVYPVDFMECLLAILWWNPFLHCVEWFRTSIYIDYTSLLDKGYLLGMATGLLALGLTIERVFRSRIINA